LTICFFFIQPQTFCNFIMFWVCHWCNGLHAVLDCGRSWVQVLIESNQGLYDWWVKYVLLFLQTSSFIDMKQTSWRFFSIKQKETNPGLCCSFCQITYLNVFSSLLWCWLWILCINNVRFIFTVVHKAQHRKMKVEQHETYKTRRGNELGYSRRVSSFWSTSDTRSVTVIWCRNPVGKKEDITGLLFYPALLSDLISIYLVCLHPPQG
jgi:hypothetical protein